MSEMSVRARKHMHEKAQRLVRTDPREKVDATDYTPPDALDADVKTGMRPISKRQYKRGGAVHGEHAKHHAGKKPRKSGGSLTAKGIVDAEMNRDKKQANELRAGSKHVGGYADGGEVVPTQRLAFGPTSGSRLTQAAGLARGGEAKGLRLIRTHTDESGRIAKVYKDPEWNEHVVKFYGSDGKYRPKADYSASDLGDAHDTAQAELKRGYKRGGRIHEDEAEDKALIRKEVKKEALRKGRDSGGLVGALEPTLKHNNGAAGGLGGIGLSMLKRGGKAESTGAFQGQEPKGGREARAHGGRTKGKTNINIIIGRGHDAGAPGSMPMPPGAMPHPPVPPQFPPGQMPMGGMPPGGAPPMGGMPPSGPPPGAMPPPPMGRKRGGRTVAHELAEEGGGAGGGLGRLHKVEAYGPR